MPIPTSINDLSTVDSTNSPQGGDPVGGNIDDYFRSHAGIIARQFKQGADIASSTTALAVPADGSSFNVTGTTAISAIAQCYTGKIITLHFTDALTLTNGSSLILPSAGNITTQAGDYATFINESTNVWRCLSYPRFEKETAQWMAKAVGEVFALRDDIAGVNAPPNANADYRYVKLTASDAYNSGVLTDESVTGTGATISATATVSLAGSPFNGLTIHLLNTERRYVRPGSAGVTEESTNLSHAHTASSDAQGYHSHGVNDPGHSHGIVADITQGTSSSRFLTQGQSNFYTYNTTPSGTGISIAGDGTHSHNITVDAAGDSESRPRSIGATYYMRVL